jgi:starch-binding outer membrane protein, SusD/RagB family
MKKIYKYIFLSVSVLLASCDSLLEVEPRQSVDSANALSTPELIRAALFGTYNNIKAQALYGTNLLAIADAMGDDTRIINRAGGRYVSEGQNVINVHLTGWGTYYYAINQANLIIKALPTSTLPDAEKATIEGEMKFLRALMYFNLARVYAYEPKANVPAAQNKGCVPLLLDGIDATEQISYPSRASAAEVYTQLYKDLNDAIAKAPTTGGPNRATKGAARALLARVALYNEDWELAAKSATDALASGVGRFVTSSELVASWRGNSHPESMFEILFNSRQESLGVNNSLQSAYTTIGSVSEAAGLSASRTTLPPAKGWGAVVPTAALLALHSTAATNRDVRRDLYQLGLNRSNSIVDECTKFLGKSGTVYMDNVPVIRVSEMYLIRSEANARLNKLTEAAADVNTIRTRAGLAALTTLTTQTAVLAEMELQRRLELAFEGHRWFDLKRWRRDVIKSTGNVTFGDTRTIAPIPNSEILANKNLVQNLGY